MMCLIYSHQEVNGPQPMLSVSGATHLMALSVYYTDSSIIIIPTWLLAFLPLCKADLVH